jgi:CheY-like chemotaxis protein
LGASILVVEGDDTLPKLLQEWWRTFFHRYEIVEARAEDKAISLAEARSPRMILADVDLPDMAGIETTRRVKAAVPSAWVVALETDYHKPLRRQPRRPVPAPL